MRTSAIGHTSKREKQKKKKKAISILHARPICLFSISILFDCRRIIAQSDWLFVLFPLLLFVDSIVSFLFFPNFSLCLAIALSRFRSLSFRAFVRKERLCVTLCMHKPRVKRNKIHYLLSKKWCLLAARSLAPKNKWIKWERKTQFERVHAGDYAIHTIDARRWCNYCYLIIMMSYDVRPLWYWLSNLLERPRVDEIIPVFFQFHCQTNRLEIVKLFNSSFAERAREWGRAKNGSSAHWMRIITTTYFGQFSPPLPDATGGCLPTSNSFDRRRHNNGRIAYQVERAERAQSK